MTHAPAALDFARLGLPAPLCQALAELGFATPTPIQRQAIPPLLDGHDLLGQAQTGTGKTAAFALPLLARLDPEQSSPQLLVLAPTRELALQVSEALQGFARHLPHYRAATLYGGQAYGAQLRDLRRGAQVVVGTPGRVMDHIRRGSLDLSRLRAVVLDEADEMLRMGFIDDVAWILEHSPAQRQVALFSATMPAAVKRIAERHLNDPVRVTVTCANSTASTIRQRYCLVPERDKTAALLRILETEPLTAGIVFVRTKATAARLSEALERHGFPCEALHGDIPQRQREQTVQRLRRGQTQLLVATDVAARGLDVERIGHVFNYDLPTDPAAYVHRIGRTGRAGRTGEAILLLTPRERRALKAIERLTGHPLTPMALPDQAAVEAARATRHRQRILALLEAGVDPAHQALADRLLSDPRLEPRGLVAALLHLAQGAPTPPKAPTDTPRPREDMARYRVAVGRRHGVRVGHLVGAIANEGALESGQIGRVELRDDHALVDLPRRLPRPTLDNLRRARVAGQRLALQCLEER